MGGGEEFFFFMMFFFILVRGVFPRIRFDKMMVFFLEGFDGVFFLCVFVFGGFFIVSFDYLFSRQNF